MLQRFLVLAACLFAGLFSLAALAEEPLDVTKAFRFSAQMLDANTIEARWEIAPGYYLYRDRFKFTLEPANANISKVETPSGEVKEDPNFGRVETYHNEVRVRLSVSGASGAVVLHATSQGCADIGICYPPQKTVANLVVPEQSAMVATAETNTTWQQRLLQPSILWPGLLSVLGIVLVVVPTRTRQQMLIVKGTGVAFLVIGAFLLLLLNKNAPERAASLAPEITLANIAV